MPRSLVTIGALIAVIGMSAVPAAAQEPTPKPQTATPADTLKVVDGFQVELLYSVPKDQQGSWVSMCTDPKGRLIVCDQYGGLYRVTPPPVGKTGEIKLEKIPAKIGDAQGLLWAFDSLYVVVNSRQKQAGLYRVTDSDGDDQLDKVELLRKIDGGGGEHGPHAVIPHPDGKRLTIVCGNQSKPIDVNSSLVPPVYGEDHLLPRMPDGRGFMKGVLAPGGCIYNVTPDGKEWELVSIGFRNEYDAAYNRDGELFTYDADMEWDANTPWYRPTRVCHVIPGSDWGWRNGTGKYPVYYPDTLPPVVNIGPGSPTGVTFGYGAKFPGKYQDAFFICDWSYGKMYAVHMQPDGSTYTGELEEFVTGTPLPLTDLVINPTDGAMYFAIGGRKTQSGLYRVTYVGGGRGQNTDTPTPTKVDDDLTLGSVRKQLAMMHGRDAAGELPLLFKTLQHPDRFIRYAARTALEWQSVDTWRAKALAETDPQASALALLALTRVSAPDPQHATPDSPKPDPALRGEILNATGPHGFADLSADVQTDQLRVYEVLFNRFGPPTDAERSAVLAKLEPAFPTGNRFVDSMLLEVLVYLQAPVAEKGVKLLLEAPTQEEQLDYTKSLRMLKAGWTPKLREDYFRWFVRAGGYKGGNSFTGFLNAIKADAVATLTPEEKTALKPIIDAEPAKEAVFTPAPRAFVKKWEHAELAPLVADGLADGGRNFDRGRKLFGAANCFACHRFDQEGGAAGPDLTAVAGRFSVPDLLESVLVPSKEISDQYAAVEIDTLSGKKLVGRIVNLNGDRIMVNTDMLNPNGIETVVRDDIDVIKPSQLSMMPTGLLDTLKEDEVLDLMAYLLSRGDRNAAVFVKK